MIKNGYQYKYAPNNTPLTNNNMIKCIEALVSKRTSSQSKFGTDDEIDKVPTSNMYEVKASSLLTPAHDSTNSVLPLFNFTNNNLQQVGTSSSNQQQVDLKRINPYANIMGTFGGQSQTSMSSINSTNPLYRFANFSDKGKSKTMNVELLQLEHEPEQKRARIGDEDPDVETYESAVKKSLIDHYRLMKEFNAVSSSRISELKQKVVLVEDRNKEVEEENAKLKDKIAQMESEMKKKGTKCFDCEKIEKVVFCNDKCHENYIQLVSIKDIF